MKTAYWIFSSIVCCTFVSFSAALSLISCHKAVGPTKCFKEASTPYKNPEELVKLGYQFWGARRHMKQIQQELRTFFIDNCLLPFDDLDHSFRQVEIGRGLGLLNQPPYVNESQNVCTRLPEALFHFLGCSIYGFMSDARYSSPLYMRNYFHHYFIYNMDLAQQLRWVDQLNNVIWSSGLKAIGPIFGIVGYLGVFVIEMVVMRKMNKAMDNSALTIHQFFSCLDIVIGFCAAGVLFPLGFLFMWGNDFCISKQGHFLNFAHGAFPADVFWRILTAVAELKGMLLTMMMVDRASAIWWPVRYSVTNNAAYAWKRIAFVTVIAALQLLASYAQVWYLKDYISNKQTLFNMVVISRCMIFIPCLVALPLNIAIGIAVAFKLSDMHQKIKDSRQKKFDHNRTSFIFVFTLFNSCSVLSLLASQLYLDIMPEFVELGHCNWCTGLFYYDMRKGVRFVAFAGGLLVPCSGFVDFGLHVIFLKKYRTELINLLRCRSQS